MKKRSKLLFLSLTVPLSILTLALSITACRGEKLPAPSNLRLDGASITWTAVPSASDYYVQVNDNTAVNVGRNTVFNIASLDSGTYTLRVKAVSEGYMDSDWAQLTVYAITYVLNGGATHLGNPTHYTAECELITVLSPTRNGFAFAGWTEGGTIPTGSTGSRTFTANWTLINYTITYELNGGTNHLNNPEGYSIESPLITLQDPTKDGYVFVRWAEGSTIPAGSVGNRTFTAVWTIRGTEGLLYTYLPDSSSYRVSRGTVNISDVVIQEYYNGLPVTHIGGFNGFTGLTNIKLPNTLTTIENNAFNGCVGLTNIVMPNSVTTIGVFAFRGCKSLENIEFSNSLTTIGADAFRDCIGLTKVELPNSLTTIGSGAFRDCTGLTNVILPNSLISLGTGVFSGCKSLINIELPNSLTTIGASAFSGTLSLTNIELPNSLITIGANAFNETGLTSIIIPNSVTSLGNYAFSYSENLTSVVIGNSVTTIPFSAFLWCTSLTKVVIPTSVRRIEDRAFLHCTALTDIYFRGTQAQWNGITIGGVHAIREDITIHLNWAG